jgi:hypothetical protein
MKNRELIEVDPADLHLPGSRRDGADPLKLQRQFARFGISTVGMPPPWVHRGTDGKLVVVDGVTRATRIAKYSPGTKISVEITADQKSPVGHLPKVGDKI